MAVRFGAGAEVGVSCHPEKHLPTIRPILARK